MPAPIAPLSGHDLWGLLVQIALLLGLALALGRLAARIGMPAVVGELLAGVLVGPTLLGHLAPDLWRNIVPADATRMHLLDAVGQLGMLLLVAITGVQLDIGLLRRRARSAVSVSLTGLVIPLALGVAVAGAVADTLTTWTTPGTSTTVFAAFLGVALCVTAIPVLAKTLSDMNLLHRDLGQLALTAGMVDDGIGWFLLSLVSAMATAGLHTGTFVASILALVGFLLAVMVIGRPLVRVALRLAARSPGTGPTIASTIVIVAVCAAVTQALHLEAVFGAFVAGVLVGAADREIGGRLTSLRDVVQWVLAPLFLATAGLRADLTALAEPDVLLAALIVLSVAVFGKFAGAYLGARSSGLSSWEGLALGACMNARGVVEVVVAIIGLNLGVINSSGYTVVVLVAIVTSLMAPPVLRWAMSRIEESDDERRRLVQHVAEWSPSPPVGHRVTPASAGPTLRE